MIAIWKPLLHGQYAPEFSLLESNHGRDKWAGSAASRSIRMVQYCTPLLEGPSRERHLECSQRGKSGKYRRCCNAPISTLLHSPSEPFRAALAIDVVALNGFNGKWEKPLTGHIAATAVLTEPSPAMRLERPLLKWNVG